MNRRSIHGLTTALTIVAILWQAAPHSLWAFDPEANLNTEANTTQPPAITAPAAPAAQPAPQELIAPSASMLPILSDPADPSGFFFTAEQMRTQAAQQNLVLSETDQRLMEWMYLLAFQFAKAPASQEAGKSLYSLFMSRAQYAEAAHIAREWIDFFGPDWTMYRNLYSALLSQGAPQEALALTSEIAKVAPTLAKSHANELTWMDYNARSLQQDYSWAASTPPFIRASYPDNYIAKIYRLYAAAPAVPQDMAALARFRAAATEKNYTEAVESARSILSLFAAPDTPRQWITELGRSFYGAGAWREGMDFFSKTLGLPSLPIPMPESSATPQEEAPAPVPAGQITQEPQPSLPPLDRERIKTELSWVMAFHLARMYQGLEQHQAAASLFIELVPLSFSNADSDSALWYWLDITMRTIAATQAAVGELDNLGEDATNGIHAARSLELSALSQAALLWKSPSYFEDIVSAYMRRLLREGAWDDVVRLCILMSQKLTSSMRGPLLYLVGRLYETGRSTVELSTESDFAKWLSSSSSESSSNSTATLIFAALLQEPGIEEHYRTLAAWRLGKEPAFLSSVPTLGMDFDIESAIAQFFPNDADPPVASEKLKDILDFISQSLNYGLESLAADQVAALSSYSTETLFWLAQKFIQHEQYYPALRIGRETLNRQDQIPELSYALLYPRAWPQHFAEITAPRKIPEPLAYGIVRSESLFNQRAVSRSGALGLSQLMPSTAAETARGLKMSQYALFEPYDNLTIGLTYFGYMFDRFNGRPVRAIAAYNAGPTRMAQWIRDWGNVEDDILIELYPVEEPRQYTKNITVAALYYGKLYYGISSQDMLDFLYGVKPLEQPALPELTASSPAPSSVAPEATPASTPILSTTSASEAPLSEPPTFPLPGETAPTSETPDTADR